MTNHVIADSDFSLDVTRGRTPRGESVFHKFGTNLTVSTTPVAVTAGGLYRMPQASAATTVRIKAGGNANDTAAGTGAREVTIQGLNALGVEVFETIATAGASASSSTTTAFMRIYRAYVSATGNYASIGSYSHVAAITIENTAGTEDWTTIPLVNGLAIAQSRIAMYTVPLGKTAYIADISITSDTTKIAYVELFVRENILETAAPYSAFRAIALWTLNGASGITDTQTYPNGPFPALTDVGFLASYAVGTASIGVAFEIVLEDEV